MWIICVDARYVDDDFYETFDTETEADERYNELLKDYEEKIEEKSVDIYLSQVIKSTAIPLLNTKNSMDI